MEVNNTDNDNIENDLQNHPLIRLMMRSIEMIPIQNENDILQTTFDEQNVKNIPTCNKFVDGLEEMYITEEDVENGLSCSICQESFKLNDKVIELPCEPQKHYFHIKNKNCDGVLPWLSQNNTCPMCRFEFPKSTEQNDIAIELETRLESGLAQYDMKVERDRNLKDKTIIGFFIYIEYFDRIVRKALSGQNPSNDGDSNNEI